MQLFYRIANIGIKNTFVHCITAVENTYFSGY